MGTDAIASLLNYGVAGIATTFVIALALFIKSLYEKQLKKAEDEIVRLRGENADLRRVLDPIAPALADMGRAVSSAITVISARGTGGS